MLPLSLSDTDMQEKASGYLAIYFSLVLCGMDLSSLYPPKRVEEIENTKNARLKAEKYSAWRLLEFAARDCLGRPLEDFVFEKAPNGKWTSSGFHFSISHSGGAVAVAVSDLPVGIDIESCSVRLTDSMTGVLSPAQHAEYDNLPLEEKKIFLLRKWTEKEARFKCSDAEIFMPRQTVDGCAALLQDLITLDGEYVYSLAYKSTLLFDSEPIRLFDSGCEIVKYRFK